MGTRTILLKIDEMRGVGNATREMYYKYGAPQRSSSRFPTKSMRGFSMVELMVVIAIIAILSAVAMAAFSQVQKRARDARRMEDMQAIAKALALFDVARGAFPVSTSVTILTGSDAVSTALKSEQTIAAVPRDLSSPVHEYTYQSNAAGNAYVLTFCLDTNSIQGYSAGCLNTITP